jgi:S1-C subfamily serine protease
MVDMKVGPVALRRVVGIVALATLLGGCTLPWQFRPMPLSADQVFARVKPTMVLIQVDYTAKVSLPKPDLSNAAIETVRNMLQAEFDSGRHPELLNHDQYAAAFENEIYNNPEKYFTPSSDVISVDGEALELNGSGFVVSENGYIATSAHVVATKDDEIRKKISDDVLKGVKEGFAAGLETDPKRTPEQKQKFKDFYEKFAGQHLKIENQQKTIHVALAKGTPGKPIKANGIPATVASAGEPVPGKDVAILKIDPGPNKLPSVAVGDEKTLKADDQVVAVGYPGESIFRNQDTDPRQVEPTLTHGGYKDSSVKATGYNALGTGATISQGESGGPMIDGHGRVVGVIAFGIADDKGNIQPNLGFAVPASVVKEYLDQAKAGAGESQTEIAYVTALREYDQKHFKTALPMFRDAKSRWKDNPYVDAYISDSEKGIVDKTDKTPPSPGEVAAWGGGGLVGVVLVLLSVIFAVHRWTEHRRLVARLAAAEAPSAAGPATPTPVAPEAVAAAATRARRASPKPKSTSAPAKPKAPAKASAKVAAGRTKAALKPKPAVSRKPVAKPKATPKPKAAAAARVSAKPGAAAKPRTAPKAKAAPKTKATPKPKAAATRRPARGRTSGS